MLKAIDAVIDARNKRVVEGKASKLEQKHYDNACKFYEKHPKLCKFVAEHQKGIGVALDIVLTADLVYIGYNLGKISLAKDLCKRVPIAMTVGLEDAGKTLAIGGSFTTPKGVKGSTMLRSNDTAKLMELANQAIEALHNNGVEFHTI